MSILKRYPHNLDFHKITGEKSYLATRTMPWLSFAAVPQRHQSGDMHY